MPPQVDYDPKVRRSFILFLFHTGCSVYEGYKKLQETMGVDFMSYQEFDFWFMRFAAGQFDVDHDYSEGYEPRSIISFPNELLQRMLENDPSDRFLVRNVCNRFRAVADAQNPTYKYIELRLLFGEISMRLDRTRVVYKQQQGHRNRTVVNYNFGRSSEQTDRYFSNVAVDNLVSVLSHPRLELDLLEFSDEIPKFNEKLVTLLTAKQLHNRLRVRTFKCLNSFVSSRILQFLQPGTLENLKISLKNLHSITKAVHVRQWMDGIKPEFDRIIGSEQYRRAQMLTLVVDMAPNVFPVQRILNFSNLTLEFSLFIVSSIQAVRIIKIFMTSENLRVYRLKIDKTTKMSTVFRLLCVLPAYIVSAPEVDPAVIRFPILNSEDFFDVELGKQYIRIERKSVSS